MIRVVCRVRRILNRDSNCLNERPQTTVLGAQTSISLLQIFILQLFVCTLH